ncbi:hypothetical protein B0H17DRAFT_1125560 [Mycena rosella]|uniref:Uncharacterized protein n=1 Tax=Mycena rosella TaxID=1033263 RepID=A0AAD7M9A8_MYCRO|nr:hypothetical protein B0H17DRAFT_1125560 [Mycena rosella]
MVAPPDYYRCRRNGGGRLALSSPAFSKPSLSANCPDLRSLRFQVSFVSARLDREGLILNTSTSHHCWTDPRLGTEKPRLAYGRLRARGRAGEWGLGGAGQGAVAREMRRSAHGNAGTASVSERLFAAGEAPGVVAWRPCSEKRRTGNWERNAEMAGVESGSLEERISNRQKAHQRNPTVDQSASKPSKRLIKAHQTIKPTKHESAQKIQARTRGRGPCANRRASQKSKREPVAMMRLTNGRTDKAIAPCDPDSGVPF